MVADRVDGVLYPAGDRRALHAVVTALLADDALRERMGRAGLAKVRGRTWHAINEQLIGHYLAVIDPGQELRLAS